MTTASDSTFTLFVETGLHAGTVQRLGPGLYTLGSEMDADIVLSDDGIEAVHLVLELDRDGLRLEPLKGSAAVDGENTALEPGGERRLTLPASFAIGEVRVGVTAPKDAVRRRRHQRLAAVAVGALVIAAAGVQSFGAFSGPVSDGAETASMPVSSAEQPLTVTVAGGSGHEPEEPQIADRSVAAPAAPEVSLDDAANALRARLAAAGLSEIDVNTGVDRLMVRGEAEPERMGAWRDIRIWFDGAFGRDVLLSANVEPAEAAEPPRLAIEAVWAGEDPYLIAGGERFAIGAAVGDGWIVDRIRTGEIVFKRGDEAFSLTL